MKSANKSRQNPAPAPPRALPGFQLFEDKASGLYYFCCGDVHGRPIFFSQAYNAKDNAAAGLNAVIRNASKPKQFKTNEEAGAFFFTLHAGNHQEIGRSIAYDNADKMLIAISYLQQVAQSEQPVAEIPQEITAKARSADLAPPVEGAAKYTFRIEYYDADKEKTLKGRIEHLQSGNSMALQGLHPEVISNFIQMRLPQSPPASSPNATQTATLRVVNHPWEIQPGTAPQTNAFVELAMELTLGSRKVPQIELEVNAQAIGGKQHLALNLSPVSVSEQGQISFALPAAYFSSGLYRIHAIARCNSDQWPAECLMQVF
jgi:uncharacterized protein YegP (UPF0339 family)